MITIQDVAKAAGVSAATVSRVLNNNPSVSIHTREKVERAIKELNYQPNLLGRNLRRSETRMILVLLQNISNPFYSKVVKGMEDVGHKNGYHIMLCNTDLNELKEKIYLDLLKNRLVDGVIFMAPVISGKELVEIDRNYPIVQCCEYREDADIPSVSIDNRKAAYQATSHLIELGHRKIGLISGQSHLISEKLREEGYRMALEDAGIPAMPELIQHGSYGYKGGLRAVKHFFSMKEKPTAIFAVSDIMAIGAIKEINERGLSVPKDIAVVGFDNTSITSMYKPTLTTVSQPRYDLGSVAMGLLIKLIQGNLLENRHIILEHELVIRQSTIAKS